MLLMCTSWHQSFSNTSLCADTSFPPYASPDIPTRKEQTGHILKVMTKYILRLYYKEYDLEYLVIKLLSVQFSPCKDVNFKYSK